MAEETPLLAQYASIKNEHPNEVLFFRLGDFYEMFNEDAVEVSRLLNLTLTHRASSPMCGIPYHAAKIYIARLLRLGKKIAIAEQVGEIAHGKGLTERKVIETITPGTAIESEYLEGNSNSFLGCFCIVKKECAFSFIDVTTGEFKATSFALEDMAVSFPKEAGRISPKELLLPESLRNHQLVNDTIQTLSGVSVSYYPDWNFNQELSYKKLIKQFNTQNLKAFSLDENSAEIIPAGFLLDYLEKTTNSVTPHINSISIYSDSEYLIIDDSSRRNLEVMRNLRDGSKEFSLFECVNYCSTAMGNRMLCQWLSFPLTNLKEIQKRQENVGLFANDMNLLKRVQEKLNGILDIERLAGRIAMDRAHAKDLQALRQSLSLWIKASEILSPYDFADSNLSDAQSIVNLIENSIFEDPSTSLTDGSIIKDGWSQELDHWRGIQKNFNEILDEYTEEEKAKTGIQNLRIRNNGNMGYFIEVTKGKLDKVPEHFMMRRTLVNAQRFTTEKLQQLEENLNESSSKILQLERDLFIEVRNSLKEKVAYLKKTSLEIAYADVCTSLATAAVRHGWVKPEMSDGKVFNVKRGRHPVVENHLPTGEFVANDLSLSENEDSPFFALITGPNMAGKSTFLRQNALISLLAQTGSFVPAESAQLGIVDRIFCRVGASDNLARGESTFLVEMTETAGILRSATDRSLVIMDEVGRGTSTEDGLSIAWSVSEYLLNKIKCKTLFATHYHELTRMEHRWLKMLCMAVRDTKEGVVFLRKVIEGASENSYGIHVASLAGVPKAVIDRANFILQKIQGEAIDKAVDLESEFSVEEEAEPSAEKTETSCAAQIVSKNYSAPGLFSEEEMILDEILSMDTDNMTPLAALEAVNRWKNSLLGK